MDKPSGQRPQWEQQQAPAQVKPPDIWGVVSLAAGLAAAGMVFGPVLTIGFAWTFAVVAMVAGANSPRGGAPAVIGIVLGMLVGLGSLGEMLFGG